MNKLSEEEIEKHFAINHLSKHGKSIDENLSTKQTLIENQRRPWLTFLRDDVRK